MRRGAADRDEESPRPRSCDRLISASRALTAQGNPLAVVELIPRLATGICAARSAQLLELSCDGAAAALASHGPPLRVPPDAIAHLARLDETRALFPLAAQEERVVHLGCGTIAPLVALPVPGGAGRHLWLLLAKEAHEGFSPQDLGELEAFAAIASAALVRARAEAAERVSHAIERAVVSAVHDAVITLDGCGVVRAVSAAAVTFIRGHANDIVGKRLSEIPGMAPLAVALCAGNRCPETVRLGNVEVRLRLRRCEAGLAVVLLAAPQKASAARIGGAHFDIGDLLGDSPAIRRAREAVFRMADSPLPILITGESGTGKEILAQSIHNASGRAEAPFVGVNLTALPRELLESELFGYEAGAFTGASARGHAGKFELAQHGTVLLDEIGDMPLEMQAKLLRVLQERVVQRLGGSRATAFNARIIASTNRDLEQEVREGRFRLDLLYRLRVVHINLPPLRDRGNDLRLVVAHHLRLLAQSTERASITIAPRVMAALEAHSWPGNLRELVNMLEGEVSMLPPGKDVIDTVPEAIERALHSPQVAPDGGEPVTLQSAEREACIRALQKAEGNVARAALILHVAKGTLYSKIRRFAIPQPLVARSAPRGSSRSGSGS